MNDGRKWVYVDETGATAALAGRIDRMLLDPAELWDSEERLAERNAVDGPTLYKTEIEGNKLTLTGPPTGRAET